MGSAKVSGIPADVTDDPALTVRAPGPTIAEAKAQHVPDEKTQGSVTRPESTAVQCAVASANRKTFEARMSRVEATLAEFYRGETIPSGRYAGQPDFTNAWQIAHDRLADGSINELIIPNGTFNITAPAEVDVEFFTGKKIFGQSRAGSIIRQLTDDVPIHRFCIRLMHSCEFRDLTYSYANMQTGKTGARVFDFVDYNDLGPACLVYNCQWRNIFGLNWYWFSFSDVVTPWGNLYQSFFVGDIAGGINCWTAPGGKPRCVFQDIYAISPSARDYMFRHHAVKAVYTGIEMNTLVDASILYDPAGGKHVLNDVRLEGGTFSASRSLFNHPNSAIIGSSVEIKTVSVASGARVTVFRSMGDGGARLQQLNADMAPGSPGGTLDLFRTDDDHARYRVTRLVATLSPTLRTNDSQATATANQITIDDWIDPGRIAFLADANAKLRYDAPVRQMTGEKLTADRTITLPEHRPQYAYECYLFGGRSYQIINTDATYSLLIRDIRNLNVATVRPGERKEIVWYRGAGIGIWLVN